MKTNKKSTPWHLLFIFPIVLMITGLWAGLFRVGWGLPILSRSLPGAHGAIMASGFIGSLIVLERAYALKKNWMYLGVFFGAAGGIVSAISLTSRVGPALMLLSSLWLVLIFIYILRFFNTLFTWIMMLGALCWLAGNTFLFFRTSVTLVAFWWITFLTLTIVGERLELSRLLRIPRWAKITLLILSLSLPISLLFFSNHIGSFIFSAALLLIAFWLFIFDVSTKTVRKEGLPRYVAIALLSGFFWLAVTGLLGLLLGSQTSNYYFDAYIHAFFIGFGIGMIFGHAPIIFPGLFLKPAFYSKNFYYPLIFLQVSLILRISGDLLLLPTIRQWGGMLNALAILSFGTIFVTEFRKAIKKN